MGRTARRVLGAGPAGACELLLRHYEHLRRSRRALPSPGPSDPSEPRRPSAPMRRATPSCARSVRSSPRISTRAQEAVRHPHGHAAVADAGPSAARALGGVGGPRRGGVGRAARRPPVSMIGIESRRSASAPCRPTGPTSGRRARCSRCRPRGGARDQCRLRAAPPGRARQPLRLRRLAGVDALAAARVRGRDWARYRQLPGPVVFVVVSRFHGGAFVVFSRKLNPARSIALRVPMRR